jgi:Rrf2 family transcriptional regulator, iron-sulfur cluster assembly transcription factor
MDGRAGPLMQTGAMRLELTRRGDYAIRAVIALARHAPDVVGASKLAEETGIPRRFVAQVMTEVVRSGIAEARLGRSGGYRLRRAAADISVLDVVTAVEGDVGRRSCVLRNAPCGRDGTCDVHGVFMAAQDALLDELRRATIAGLVTPAGETTGSPP